MKRHIVVVSRNEPQLYGYLSEMFAGDPTVQVILDRRFGDRRQRTEEYSPERRRQDSRKNVEATLHLQSRGYAFLCLD
jgi:hypothetical protein